LIYIGRLKCQAIIKTHLRKRATIFAKTCFEHPSPKQASRITWQLMPTAPSSSCVRVTVSNDLTAFRMSFQIPLALRTTGIQNYLRLLGTTSPRIRFQWLAAGAKNSHSVT